MNSVDLSKYHEDKPLRWKRLVWAIVGQNIFKLLFWHGWNRLHSLILNLFGCQIEGLSLIYPSVKIYAPWNLKIGNMSCVGPGVEIYNKGMVEIGDNVVISQGAYICTASHDVSSTSMALVVKPITICNGAWICAKAFVLPGVTIGEGAVVAAGAVVAKDVEPWTVVGGNPAKFIKRRVLKND